MMFDIESTRIVERRRRVAEVRRAALIRASRRGQAPRIRALLAMRLRALAERLDPGAAERFEEARA